VFHVATGSLPAPALLDGDELEPPRSKPSRVRGRLAWAGSGLPIAGVEVRAQRSWQRGVVGRDLKLVARAVEPVHRDDLTLGAASLTDASGRFDLSGVVETDGPISLLVLRDGHRFETRMLQPQPRPGEVLELGD
jgi:hypothetical protein